MWGAEPRAAALNSITFVSQISVEKGIKEDYGLHKRVEGVRRCRDIGKKDMKWNDSMPRMKGAYRVSVPCVSFDVIDVPVKSCLV